MLSLGGDGYVPGFYFRRLTASCLSSLFPISNNFGTSVVSRAFPLPHSLADYLCGLL